MSKSQSKFSQQFAKYVCEGDSISCKAGKFTATATIYRDDCTDSPDQRQDGFWPSCNPKDAGYVLPENYESEQAKAKEVMRAWNADEWFYCGVAVTIERAGIVLTGRYDNALWGVDCNYPGADNSYLCDVANELLGEALEQAEAKMQELAQ